jgi:hypothetical protein
MEQLTSDQEELFNLITGPGKWCPSLMKSPEKFESIEEEIAYWKKFQRVLRRNFALKTLRFEKEVFILRNREGTALAQKALEMQNSISLRSSAGYLEQIQNRKAKAWRDYQKKLMEIEEEEREEKEKALKENENGLDESFFEGVTKKLDKGADQAGKAEKSKENKGYSQWIVKGVIISVVTPIVKVVVSKGFSVVIPIVKSIVIQ